MSSFGERPFDLSGDGGIHGGEDEARRVAWLRIGDDDVGGVGWHVAIQTPGGSVFQLFAGGTVAGAEPSELEPGMPLQESG